MGEHNETLTHIDSTRMDVWLPNLLGVKGYATKPQKWDISKAIGVVDLGQGGFSNESVQEVTDIAALDLSGNPSRLIHPGFSCRYGAGGGPGNAPKNEGPFHGRVTRAEVRLTLNSAAASTLDGRWFRLAIGLTDDAGNQLYLQSSMFQIDNERLDYSMVVDKSIIVMPATELVIAGFLQVDLSGGMGSPNCPPSTLLSGTYQGYKKPLGGRLPL